MGIDQGKLVTALYTMVDSVSTTVSLCFKYPQHLILLL